jgi:LPXTG-site transpeptidase (sortase) family protein
MPAKRRKKQHKPKALPLFPILLITLGMLCVGFWGAHRVLYERSLTLSDAILARFAKEQPKGLALPIHITISNTINLPVVPAGKVDGVWAISKTSANYVHGSAVPGQPGNTIIYAHNSPEMFGPLDKVKEGDAVAVRATDGTLHRYTVSSVVWVTPGHTELLSPTKEETITLYTCGGLLDALRIVVRAEPIR